MITEIKPRKNKLEPETLLILNSKGKPMLIENILMSNKIMWTLGGGKSVGLCTYVPMYIGVYMYVNTYKFTV